MDKQVITKEYSGAITVFLALIFVCVCALVLTLVESARVMGLHYHVKVASNSALESLFSEYNNELWDRYRIPSYECRSEDTAKESIVRYMQPYMQAGSWMRMNSAQVQITDMKTLPDGEGQYFEQDVLSYMNYGLAESLFDIEVSGSVDKLWDDLKESRAIREITDDYAEKSAVAIKAEEALDKVAASLSDQQALKARAIDALRRGSGTAFDRIADDMVKEMDRMAGSDNEGSLICEYETASYDLEEQMDAVDEKHADRYGDLSEEGRNIVAGVKADYSGYSSAEKGRRTEVEQIYAVTQDNEVLIDNAKAAADMIEALEEEMAEERAAAAAANSDDPDFDPDPADYYEILYDLWGELADAFDSVDIRTIQSAHGVADKTKKGFLETAKSLLSGEILALVVPEGTQISTTALAVKGDTAQYGRTLPYLTVTEKAIIAEYIGRYFTEFTDERTGAAAYEMEYICAGRSTDRDNLATAVAEVFVIREGLNYLHIMMDSAKRNEARLLAQEIVLGTTGGTLEALVPVIECLIIGVWAGAESVIDCRALLRGNKVALYKNNDQWKTAVSAILQWGESRSLSGSNKGDEDGLVYEQYLKFLVLLLNPRERNSRTMDIIELNICRNDPEFLMSRCIYGMDTEVTVGCTHIFTSLPVISGEVTGLSRNFTIKTGARKEY